MSRRAGRQRGPRTRARSPRTPRATAAIVAEVAGPSPGGFRGYAIGDPGRAAAEVPAGLPTGPTCWPDSVIDIACVGPAQVRAASVRGAMHRCLNEPRQDSYSLALQNDSASLLVTVCDGVGSLEGSHEAADLVSRRMPAALHQASASGPLQWTQAFESVSKELAAHRQTRNFDMATTVICASIATTAEGAVVDIAWIGDSAAYLLHPTGWEVVGGTVKTVAVEAGPLSSATSALPAAVITVGTNTVTVEPGTALFLMTDGVADPLGTGRGEVGRTLARWWSAPPDKFEFAAQTAFARRSFDDDRTVVGVWLEPPR